MLVLERVIFPLLRTFLDLKFKVINPGSGPGVLRSFGARYLRVLIEKETGKMRQKHQFGSIYFRRLLLSLFVMVGLLVFISPALAQTTPATPGGATAPATQSTDTPNDLIKALAGQDFYVSQSVKKTINGASGFDSTLANATKNLKGKNHDSRIAIVDDALLKQSPQSNGGNPVDYASWAEGYLNNPKPEIVVAVNATTKKVGLYSPKLTVAESQAIVDSSLSTFNTKSYADGAVEIAQKAADKIGANQTGGTITTLVVVLLILAVIGGALAFMYFSTRTWWKNRLGEVQGLAGQVSNQVLKLSDTIDYLPDGVKNNTRNIFSQATSNFSNANSNLQKLETTNPWTLIFKRGEYNKQLEMTSSQFQTSRNALAQVQETVDRESHF